MISLLRQKELISGTLKEVLSPKRFKKQWNQRLKNQWLKNSLSNKSKHNPSQHNPNQHKLSHCNNLGNQLHNQQLLGLRFNNKMISSRFPTKALKKMIEAHNQSLSNKENLKNLKAKNQQEPLWLKMHLDKMKVGKKIKKKIILSLLRDALTIWHLHTNWDLFS